MRITKRKEKNITKKEQKDNEKNKIKKEWK